MLVYLKGENKGLSLWALYLLVYNTITEWHPVQKSFDTQAWDSFWMGWL